jgi:hypothetical protein
VARLTPARLVPSGTMNRSVVFGVVGGLVWFAAGILVGWVIWG